MGIFSNKDKYPASNEIVLNPKQFNHGKLDKGERKLVAQRLMEKKKSLSIGDEFRLSDINGKFKVLKISPEPSIPNENTIVKLRNRIVYEQGYDEFDIAEDRIVEVGDKPELDDLKEVRNPEDFAKLVDSGSAFVEYYSEEDLYVFADYYFKFE